LDALLRALEAFAAVHRVSRSERRRAASDVRVAYAEAVRRGMAPDGVHLGASSDGVGHLMVVVGDADSVCEVLQARLESGRAVVH
jgi:hypothetical protein